MPFDGDEGKESGKRFILYTVATAMLLALRPPHAFHYGKEEENTERKRKRVKRENKKVAIAIVEMIALGDAAAGR